MADPPSAPRWARRVINRVNCIQVLCLKRALAREVENLQRATGRKERRKTLLAVHQINGRLIEAMGGDGDPLPCDVPMAPSARYVNRELEALPLMVAELSEASRRRMLVRGRLIAERALRSLVGLMICGGCALCNSPFLDNVVEPGPSHALGILIASCARFGINS